MLISDMIVYLTAKGVGGTLFDSFEDLDGSFTGIRSILTPTSGFGPLMTHNHPDTRIDQPRFQVITQGSNPANTEQEAHRVQREFTRIRNQTINGNFYLSVVPLQPPFFLEWSEPVSGVREIGYVANYEVMKRPELG